MLNKILKRGKTENHVHTDYDKIDVNSVPKHVAIIMDGNGRWAKKRNLPRIAGHREGMNTVKKIVKAANRIGVKELTLYAFSTENWKRPRTEVDFLMKLPEEFLGSFLPELIEQNVQVRIMGNERELPNHTLKAVKSAIEQTKDHDGMILNFALNYGSRNELIQAVNAIIHDVKSGDISETDITEERFNDYLLSKGLEDPDLLIRTSGEIRLSNFMLWQLAYTELWFTDILWPDFSKDDFLNAILDYQKRTRRYGGV